MSTPTFSIAPYAQEDGQAIANLDDVPSESRRSNGLGRLLHGSDHSTGVLYVFFFIPAHDRRRVVHFNVTENPTAGWTAQQIVEAFSRRHRASFLLRERDGIYGHDFTTRVDGLGIRQVPISARSPWQNRYSERMIGSIRREFGGFERRQRIAILRPILTLFLMGMLVTRWGIVSKRSENPRQTEHGRKRQTTSRRSVENGKARDPYYAALFS